MNCYRISLKFQILLRPMKINIAQIKSNFSPCRNFQQVNKMWKSDQDRRGLSQQLVEHPVVLNHLQAMSHNVGNIQLD